MQEIQPVNVRSRVLVVDDDEAVALFLNDVLHECGYDVLTVHTGEDALAALGKPTLFDVILLDIIMPGMDGFDVLERVKHLPLPHPRVIMLSCLDNVDEKVKAFSLGAVDYVVKPFKEAELIARVETQAQLQRTLRELAGSEIRFRSLAENSPDVIYIIEMIPGPPRFLYMNQPTILGYSAEEVFNAQFVHNFHPDDVVKVMDAFYRMGRGESISLEYRIRHKGGKWEWIQARHTRLNIPGETEGHPLFLVNLSQITERKILELRESERNHIMESIAHEEALDEVTRKISDMVSHQYLDAFSLIHYLHGDTLFDAHGFMEVTSESESGSTTRRAFTVNDQGDVFSQVILSGKPLVRLELDAGTGRKLEELCGTSNFLPRAQMRSIWAYPILSADYETIGVVTLCLSEAQKPGADDEKLMETACHLAALALDRHRMRVQVSFQEHRDALTGLYNLYTFSDSLQKLMDEADANDRVIGLFFLDLDRFRWINDTLGHYTGDQILIQVANRLRGFMPRGGYLARMGADHFALLFDHVEEVPMLLGTAQSILDSFKTPFFVREREVALTASIGISIYPGDGDDAAALLRHADQALQQAKNSGRNDFQRYSARMGDVAAKELVLESHLRRALEHGEFALVYQPLIDLRLNRLVGVEALLRWHSPELGPVMPGDFIRLAEETGLIVPIGMWALEEACRQSRRWEESGVDVPVIAVNISALQFQRDDFVTNIALYLRRNRLSAERIHLELTESVLMQDLKTVAGRLSRLRSIGLNIWIDDFGTGYSSLQYLQELPIDGLKVDRSFLHRLTMQENEPERQDKNAAFYRAIVDLAHSLDLEVIAEGVETSQHLDWVMRTGCDIGQGYYYARPLAPQDLAGFLKAPLPFAGLKS